MDTKNVSGQIFPLRIRRKEERNLLLTSKLLHLNLSVLGYSGIGVGLEVHQPINLILLGEAVECSSPVLKNTTRKIVRQPNIERARKTGQNVNVVELSHTGSSV